MLVFPNAKINIGLRVLCRRPDGYHNLESLMVPVPWCDILEMVPARTGEGSFTMTGSDLGGCPPEKNLVLKALKALETELGQALPPFDIFLHKVIPNGAGLGGGSSDASFALVAANELAGLGLSKERLAEIVLKVGADCPFFIYNRPMMMRGIGDILTPFDIQLPEGLAVAIVMPEGEPVSTKEAYAGVTPCGKPEGVGLEEELLRGFDLWRTRRVVVNDFEPSVIAVRPDIATALAVLREQGALYAAMSGSGSAVFGLFEDVKMAERAIDSFEGCRCFAAPLSV